jgi:hypothetical protein
VTFLGVEHASTSEATEEAVEVEVLEELPLDIAPDPQGITAMLASMLLKTGVVHNEQAEEILEKLNYDAILAPSDQQKLMELIENVDYNPIKRK